MSVKHRTLVWDIPVRVFHWLLVLLVVGQFVSASMGGDAMKWHVNAGCAILVLVLFRILWGWVGSPLARFSSFLFSPRKVVEFAAQAFRGHPPAYPGHNPLGGLMVLAFLALLLVMAALGLFANDDISVEGPLMGWVSKHLSDKLTTFHKWGGKALIGLIVLHVSAVLVHLLVWKDNLIRPMFTGYKEMRSDPLLEMRPAPTLRAVLLLLASVLLLLLLIQASPPAAVGF